HHNHRKSPGNRTAPWIQAPQTDGFQRPLSDRLRAISGLTGRFGEASSQRLVFYLRTGDLSGPRIWISLRLFGIVAHGHRPTTARTGVRLESYHHGGNGYLSHRYSVGGHSVH